MPDDKTGYYHDPFIKAASPWLILNGTECWKDLLVYGQQIILPKGRVLFAPGSPVPHFYYLLHGEIMMRSYSPEGRQKIIWYIEEGNVFGETPFFCGIPTFLEIIATKQSEVYKFTKEFIFSELIPNHPQAVAEIIKTLAYKVAILAMQVHDMSFSTPYNRICHLFYILGHLYGEPCPNGLRVKKHITHQEIADLLGIHRVTVSKIVNDLHKKGVIKISSNSLLITDPHFLYEAMVTVEPDI